MAIRICPLCMARVPAGPVGAYSDSLECPKCKTRLEVSRGSRLIASTLGLVAAWLVYRVTRGDTGELGFVLPVVYAFLAYSIVSPLFLMLAADLRPHPAEPLAEPLPGSAGHH